MILDTNSNLNECSDGIKRIAPSFVLDVALPSLDAYSDISLITGWYLNGHFDYAISMTVPILLQFLSTIYKWVRLEKRENKKMVMVTIISTILATMACNLYHAA